MSTTEQTLPSKIAAGRLPLAGRRMSIFAKLISACRVLRNRIEITRLEDLDDNQLSDIGLTRSELNRALMGSSFFEDPSSHLTQAARRRANSAGRGDTWA